MTALNSHKKHRPRMDTDSHGFFLNCGPSVCWIYSFRTPATTDHFPVTAVNGTVASPFIQKSAAPELFSKAEPITASVSFSNPCPSVSIRGPKE